MATTDARQERGVVQYEMQNGDVMKLNFDTVRRYLVSGNAELVTNQELMFFMAECKARRLNPFLRECWLIKYSKSENAQIVESIHHKRARAMANEQCQGWEKGLILVDDETGGKEVRTAGLMKARHTLVGAWFRATPKGWNVPYELEINLDGYIKKTRNGDITAFWQKEKQPTQLMKVVESQGLSALFGGVGQAHTYIEEELPEPEMVDVTPGKVPGMQDPDDEVDHDQEEVERIRNEFNETFHDLTGIPEFDKFTKAAAKNADMTEVQLMESAVSNAESYRTAYENWAPVNPRKRSSPPPEEEFDTRTAGETQEGLGDDDAIGELEELNIWMDDIKMAGDEDGLNIATTKAGFKRLPTTLESLRKVKQAYLGMLK